MLLLALAGLVAEGPNTCQPRSAHPFLPIYHIIGNVTTNSDEEVVSIESINDVIRHSMEGKSVVDTCGCLCALCIHVIVL